MGTELTAEGLESAYSSYTRPREVSTEYMDFFGTSEPSEFATDLETMMDREPIDLEVNLLFDAMRFCDIVAQPIEGTADSHDAQNALIIVNTLWTALPQPDQADRLVRYLYAGRILIDHFGTGRSSFNENRIQLMKSLAMLLMYEINYFDLREIPDNVRELSVMCIAIAVENFSDDPEFAKRYALFHSQNEGVEHFLDSLWRVALKRYRTPNWTHEEVEASA